ncbi:DUF1016 N-terminal domain-containing protein [Deltaproteobacteria bacterium TL4]
MSNLSFNSLIETIQQTHLSFQEQVVKSVNVGLTLRNWLIGFYIVEFEQNGDDRAKYGTALLSNIARNIAIKGLTTPELSRCRQFYTVYPKILGSVTQDLICSVSDKKSLSVTTDQILGTASQKLLSGENNLMASLSYSHFIELVKIENPVKRKYYELLILKTQPTVKALKREIATLSYERLGMSADKEKAFSQLTQKITPSLPQNIIKSHYFFEFLGLNTPEQVEESELEIALSIICNSL